MSSARFLVRGTVQGVGFRRFVERHANRLELSGFVRNLPDGSVEVSASGRDEAVDALETRLRQGPPAGRVEQVQRSAPPTAQDGDLRGFRIL